MPGSFVFINIVAMYIQNISFIIVRERERELLDWLEDNKTVLTGTGGINHRLSILRETAGASDVTAEAQTIAFQAEFCDMKALRAWMDNSIHPLIIQFETKFGPEAVAFTSVFETLEWN